MIIAGMLRIILAEGWHDKEFCNRFVGADRMRDLVAAVAPFEQEFVESRSDLKPGQLREAAAMFARDNKRGGGFTATGPSMGPFSNLMQHLADVLNVVGGRFLRAGERAIVNPRDPPRAIFAEVIPPPRSWTGRAPSRTRGVRQLFGERMTGTLADEILAPGKGQIKALIVDGANAVNAIPDQLRIVEALRSLQLLVVVDPTPPNTAKLAHFMIPPTMPYERADLPIYVPGFPLQHDNFRHYTPAVLSPPADSDVIDGWRFYWEIAARLGVTIKYAGTETLDMVRLPTTDELIAVLMRNAAVALDELKQHPSGAIFEPSGTIRAQIHFQMLGGRRAPIDDRGRRFITHNFLPSPSQLGRQAALGTRVERAIGARQPC